MVLSLCTLEDNVVEDWNVDRKDSSVWTRWQHGISRSRSMETTAAVTESHEKIIRIGFSHCVHCDCVTTVSSETLELRPAMPVGPLSFYFTLFLCDLRRSCMKGTGL